VIFFEKKCTFCILFLLIIGFTYFMINQIRGSGYPAKPEEVIAAYLKAHGKGNLKEMNKYLTERKIKLESQPNVLKPDKPIYQTLKILSIRESDELLKLKNKSGEHNTKIFLVEWEAKLTDYGKKVYTRPSGKMSFYFTLVKDLDSRWKIDDWGY